MNIDKLKTKDIGEYFGFIAKRSGKVFRNKMKIEKLIDLNSDDIVLDIGAYVGEFSMYANNKGVKKVISYEASPQTFEVLKMNKRGVMEIHNKAVIGGSETEIDLYLANGIGVTNSIVKTKGKKGKIKVPAINFTEAIKNATIVKIDVEGAEYTYDYNQPHLRGIILEVHPITDFDWKERAETIFTQLETDGFKCLYKPEYKNGFDMHGAWIRD